MAGNSPLDVESLARDLTDRKVFIDDEDRNLRTIGYRLANILQTSDTVKQTVDNGPGGRHDDDFANFRSVAIFPTDDELMSTEQAFYQAADAISQQPYQQRPGAHLDNQFRLLREDFLAELKEDIKGSQSNAKGQRSRLRLRGLSLVGAHYGTDRFRTPFALELSVKSGLENFSMMGRNQRKNYLKNNSKFLKHQSFGCVVDRKRVVAFVTLLCAEDLLIGGSDDDDEPHEPLVVLRAPDRSSLEKLPTERISSWSTPQSSRTSLSLGACNRPWSCLCGRSYSQSVTRRLKLPSGCPMLRPSTSSATSTMTEDPTYSQHFLFLGPLIWTNHSWIRYSPVCVSPFLSSRDHQGPASPSSVRCSLEPWWSKHLRRS